MKTLLIGIIILFSSLNIAYAITGVAVTDITPTRDGNWNDVDVTSFVGTDAGSVAGVLLEIQSEATSGGLTFGVRKNGSSDTYTEEIFTEEHFYYGIGVDGSDILEIWVDDANLSVFIHGYITTAEGFFLTNAVDKSENTNLDSWEDVDISGDTTSAGTANAIVAFAQVRGDGTFQNFGIRENGSTDNRVASIINADTNLGTMVGCDASEIFEQWVDTAGIDLFLLGWLTTNATTFANAKDYSTGTTGSYVDVDYSTDIPASNTGSFIQGYNNGSFGLFHDVRKNGTAVDHSDHEYTSLTMGWIEIDGDRVAEQYIEATSQDLFLWGYTNEPVAAPSGAPQVIIIR